MCFRRFEVLGSRGSQALVKVQDGLPFSLCSAPSRFCGDPFAYP
jgi:hypothetical protein